MRKKILAAACMLTAAMLPLWGCGETADQQNGAGTGTQEAGETAGMTDTEAGQTADTVGSMEAGAAGEASDTLYGAGTQEAGTAGETADNEDGAGIRNEAAAGTAGTEEAARLAGTTVSIFGDSISTYRDCNPAGYSVFFPEFGELQAVEDTWWKIVVDDLGLMLYANGSSSGSTVAGDSTGTEDPRCGCNELRTNDLSGPEGACPDRIVIFMGTNDMLNAVPLGDNDGTRLVEEGEVETFTDAYTLMLDKLQANYPLAEFYCCTLLPVGDYGTDTPYVEFVNGAQLTSKDYGEAIARIAGSRGLCVIDLYDCGVTIENLHEMTSDGVHPTAEGMRCIAGAVEKALAGEQASGR